MLEEGLGACSVTVCGVALLRTQPLTLALHLQLLVHLMHVPSWRTMTMMTTSLRRPRYLAWVGVGGQKRVVSGERGLCGVGILRWSPALDPPVASTRFCFPAPDHSCCTHHCAFWVRRNYLFTCDVLFRPHPPCLSSLLPLCFTAVPEPVVEAEEEPEEPEASGRKSTLADLYDLVAGARALVVDVTPGMCAASLTQPALVCVMGSV